MQVFVPPTLCSEALRVSGLGRWGALERLEREFEHALCLLKSASCVAGEMAQWVGVLSMLISAVNDVCNPRAEE